MKFRPVCGFDFLDTVLGIPLTYNMVSWLHTLIYFFDFKLRTQYQLYPLPYWSPHKLTHWDFNSPLPLKPPSYTFILHLRLLGSP